MGLPHLGVPGGIEFDREVDREVHHFADGVQEGLSFPRAVSSGQPNKDTAATKQAVPVCFTLATSVSSLS